MPATRITCKGCTRPFPTITGYRSHLFQTRNALCIAVRHKLAIANGKRLAARVDSEDDRSNSNSDTSSTFSATDSTDSKNEGVGLSEPESRKFAGDFFGGSDVYEDDLFGQDEDGQDMGQGGVADEEDMGDLDLASDVEDEITAELEGDIWDPVRETMPLAAAANNTSAPTNLDEEDNLEQAAIAEMQARKIAEDIIAAAGHGMKPASTVRYSEVHRSSKVGEVLVNEGTSDERYQTTVGKSNPWAPFVSQTDWELARWAKLRGSKSTAFTDLLGVDSVSILNSCEAR